VQLKNTCIFKLIAQNIEIIRYYFDTPSLIYYFILEVMSSSNLLYQGDTNNIPDSLNRFCFREWYLTLKELYSTSYWVCFYCKQNKYCDFVQSKILTSMNWKRTKITTDFLYLYARQQFCKHGLNFLTSMNWHFCKHDRRP
jgi:hypothetical protein